MVSVDAVAPGASDWPGLSKGVDAGGRPGGGSTSGAAFGQLSCYVRGRRRPLRTGITAKLYQRVFGMKRNASTGTPGCLGEARENC